MITTDGSKLGDSEHVISCWPALKARIDAQKTNWLAQLDTELTSHRSFSISKIHHCLEIAEKRSLQKLLNAMLREGLLTFQDTEFFCLERKDRWICMNGQALLKASSALRSGLGGLLVFDGLIRVLPLNIEGRCVSEINYSVELLSVLVDSGQVSLDVARRFSFDVQDSILNDALALAYRDSWDAYLRDQMVEHQTENLWWWCLNALSANQRSIFFEQWGTTGHPFHPTDKSKQGLSPAEVVSMSPEYEGGAEVRLAAIAKVHVHVESMDNLLYEDWFKAHFPEWFGQWQARLEALTLRPEDYCPIPVYPWQAENILPELFEHLLESRDLVLLDGPLLETRASMSFRTMMAADLWMKPHIKLPIALQMTSAKRLLSTRSCEMGPRFSQLMKGLLIRDARLGQYLAIMPELVGVHYRTDQGNEDSLGANLSVLFRLNPQLCCESGKITVPAGSLLTNLPEYPGKTAGSSPFIVDVMHCNGVVTRDQVLAYVKTYLQVVLDGPLRLYLQYGIALEAHQQNSLIEFDPDGTPRKIIVRDFGAFRIHKTRFLRAGLSMTFHHDQRLLTDDLNEVRDKLIHALLISHVGELVQAVSLHYQIPEINFWCLVREIIDGVMSGYRAEMEPESFAADYHALVQQRWNIKALLRMRLENTGDYIYQRLDNPLTKV